MPRTRTLTDDDVRRRRTAAQHLHRRRRRSAADLVRHLAGVQAQSLPAARLAFAARTEGLTAERVDRARLHDRSIVHTWAMRGTLYLIAAEDYGWLVPLVVEPQVRNALRLEVVSRSCELPRLASDLPSAQSEPLGPVRAERLRDLQRSGVMV